MGKNATRFALAAFLFICLSIYASRDTRALEPSADLTASAESIAELRGWLSKPAKGRGEFSTQTFATTPLSKADAQRVRALLWSDHTATLRAEREKEWKDESITLAGHTLLFKQRQFGRRPKDGWSLYISMHGGGGTAHEVNDQQWQNQIGLYQPKEGIYLAPRAPTDNWNLWHEGHIDALFDRLLADAFVLADVNPNRVYLMGYSAGGDGVYQLAPRMADRWAAASMMAGHPNDASPLGLRNIGFAIHVGALDAGYNRNKIAAEWGKMLDDLHAADPLGYVHVVSLHPNRAHWMNLEDKVSVEWMAGFTRDPLPQKVVWKQGGTTHDRFYWLAVPQDSAMPGTLVIASRDKQVIQIEKADGITKLNIMLSDAMLDLDQPVTIRAKDKQLFKGLIRRTAATLRSTLQSRGDPDLMFDAMVPVQLDPP